MLKSNLDTLPEVEEYYKNLHTDNLMQLTQNPEDLRLDVIPVLQKELLKRQLQDEALSLTYFLQKKLSTECPKQPLPSKKMIWRSIIFAILLIILFAIGIFIDIQYTFDVRIIIDVFFLFMGLYLLVDAIGNLKKLKMHKSDIDCD